MFYSHSGNTQKEIFGKDVLSYTVDVLGGVQYQFYVRAVTVKPGPNISSNVKVPEYSEFSFHFKHILKMHFVFAMYIWVYKYKRYCMGL